MIATVLDYHDLNFLHFVLRSVVLHRTILNSLVASHPYLSVEFIRQVYETFVVRGFGHTAVTVEAFSDSVVQKTRVAIAHEHAEIAAVILLVKIQRPFAVRVADTGLARTAETVSRAFDLRQNIFLIYLFDLFCKDCFYQALEDVTSLLLRRTYKIKNI